MKTAIKPRWQYVCVVDLVEQLNRSGTCCECKRSLRYAHILKHPKYGQHAFGRCCAAKKCKGYDATEAERECRNLSQRRLRFLKPDGWRTSSKGNLYRETHDYVVTIFPSKDEPDRFKAYIYLKDEDWKECSPGSYDTEQEAMSDAFDALANMLDW